MVSVSTVGGGGDGAGDDLALHQQALDARVDQTGAELRQIENADHEREQAGHVEEDDAPAQARKGDACEELPPAQQQRGEAPSSGCRERGAVIAPLQLDLEALERAIELAEIKRGRASEALPALRYEVDGLGAVPRSPAKAGSRALARGGRGSKVKGDGKASGFATTGDGRGARAWRTPRHPAAAARGRSGSRSRRAKKSRGPSATSFSIARRAGVRFQRATIWRRRLASRRRS